MKQTKLMADVKALVDGLDIKLASVTKQLPPGRPYVALAAWKKNYKIQWDGTTYTLTTPARSAHRGETATTTIKQSTTLDDLRLPLIDHMIGSIARTEATAQRTLKRCHSQLVDLVCLQSRIKAL